MAPARKLLKKLKRGPKRVVRPEPPREEPPQSSQAERPTRYTWDLGERICERLAAGETATAICREPGYPTYPVLKRWERDYQDFAKRYDTARKQGCEYRTDEIMEIADNAVNDFVQRTRKDGSTYLAFDRETFERSRLRVQARQWEAQKVLRHVYGERAEVDLRTPDGVKIQTEERNALIDALCKLVTPKADGQTKPDKDEEPRGR